MTRQQQTLGGRRATAEDSKRLVYTNAVIKESLRLYPPVWMTARDSRWFADPETFRPERWLDGSLEELPKYAYFPFGGGPRLCMGASLAKLALVLVISTVVRRYRLTLAAGAKISPFTVASFLIPQGVRLVPTART